MRGGRRGRAALLRALAAAFLLHASASAASDRSHLSSDPRVEDARALVESGRFDAALAALRPLAPSHPDRTDVLFLLGLAALGAAERSGTGEEGRTALLDEAVAALRAILIDRPALTRVRLELARAFFLLGEDDLSRAHFERVLAGKPPPAVAANVRRFLEAIRARGRAQGHFGAALAPDSNVNAASGAEVIRIGGLPFRLDAPADRHSGTGVVVWGGGEYQHPLGPRWRLRAGADAARRDYAGSGFDRTFLSGHAGPRWRAGAETEASLLASARRRWIAGAPYSHALGARLEIDRRLDRRWTARARASWHRREHRRDGRRFDGPVLDFSLGAAWRAAPTLRVEATVGYARERPKAAVWRNSTRWARAGVSAALPAGFTLGASAELRWTGYRGRWWPFTPDGAARKDRVRVLGVSVFNRAFTIGGFSPQLVLANEVRESNAQLYPYDRNRAELRLVRQF